jgi:hypothetical protein
MCGCSDGKTAMHLAVEGGHPHIVRSLFYAYYWLGLEAPNLNIKDELAILLLLYEKTRCS